MSNVNQPAAQILAGHSDVLAMLVCPRDKQELTYNGTHLICPQGHRYAVIEGVPILLVSDAEQTHIEGARSLAMAESGDISGLPRIEVGPNEIDPYVRASIGATNGGLYQHLVGSLSEYPIPRLRLPAGKDRLFLEVGCNWGRWCVAAARLGYRVVGIDPSFKSVRAAKRVAKQFGIPACYIVADARYLPFRDQNFDQVFSYSVLQHLSKENVCIALDELHRTLRAGGNVLVQMPNVYGLRCLYHQLRRGFRTAQDFEVRYWTPAELLDTFNRRIGHSELSIDGFFSLNIQPTDLHLLPPRYRALVHASEALRRVNSIFPILLKFADSLYISATRARAA